jgi:hydroxymethylpyrimidine/phosphomethylpyrimidine kinase
LRHPPISTPIALTIAGSDAGGGAGIQADLRVFSRLGVFGTTAVTAITAQNTVAVYQWEAVSPALVRAQIDAIASDLRPRAIKSGMLANAEIARVVATALRDHALTPYVLDPVIAASTGATLLSTDGVEVVRRELVPLAALVTPNLAEAAALTGEPVDDLAGMERAARALVDRLGAHAALVTGGHLGGPNAIDVLYDGAQPPIRFRHRRLTTRHTHGTGCTLSAAVVARLALGDSLLDALRAAIRYVQRALKHPPGLGAGNGPVGF